MASNQNTLKRALATRRQRTSRANSEDVCLDSEDPSPKASPKPQRHTKFDIQDNDDHQSDDESSKAEGALIQTDQAGEKQSRNWCFFCRIQVESKTIRLLFRFCAIFNILSLVFSAPFFICPKDLPGTPSLPLGSSPGGNLSHNEFDGLKSCNNVFIQYSIITVVDFLLAVFYTLQTLARIEYLIYLRRTKSRKSLEVPEIRFGPDNSPIQDESYGSVLRLINLIIITLALWYSVGIGVYRTYIVATNRADPQIHWAYYWGLPFRMLSLFTAVKLLRYLALIKSSDFRDILDNIQKALNNLKKNKKRFYQLLVVTLFYLFFIYVFALVGVQWIGGLDTKCMHNDSNNFSLAIPVTHCVITESDLMPRERTCFANENGDSFDCQGKGKALDINKRNTVYLGQFRTILDAMFGVYEASSWELWIFMWYNAASGAPRTQFSIFIFYSLLFSFLVIFIQQSIFLVVIIESFADLRVESSSDSTKPVTDKPAIVLSDPLGQGNELHLTLIKKESSNAFQRKFNKYYYSWWRGWVGIETAFIFLVIVDAIVFASKSSNMSSVWGEILDYWQIAVSIIFFLEIGGVLVVHLFYKQPRLFFESKYFWYLMIVAVTSLVSAGLYRTNMVSGVNVLAVSQAARGPRVLRLPLINQFFKRVFGNGSRLIMVTVAVLVLLGVFSVVAVQVFGYLPVEPGCERTGAGQFSDFFTGFQSMFQLVMQEGWTELMGEVMCHRTGSWVLINAAFIGLHLLGSLILLNIFVAAILDNLEYDDDTKRQKLEEDLKKQKVEKVPRDLKLFKQFGQKKISGPKISSIDVPNLTEADVRNFYNVGEATDFPVSYDNESEPAHLVSDFSAERQSSVLSDIDLLTEDKSHLLQSSVSSHHGWYYGIQGILNYIKAFREHSQAVEGSRRGQGVSGRSTVGGVGGQVDSTLQGQSEYDEYREKYRLFDSALFCLPPEHKLRRVCKKIITYRVSLPKSNPTNNPASNWRQIPGKWWSYFAYFIRYVVSSAPVFYWCIDLLTLATLFVQAWELWTHEDTTPNPSYIWISDLVFVLATLTELVLKIIVNGVLLNPNGALRCLWGWLDWLIMLATLIVMIVYLVACGCMISFEVTFSPALVLPYMQALLTIRAFRPIRMISLIPSMRRVVLDIIEGWRSFVLALFLFLLFLFLFASLGVQLFAGENSPQKFCNDPNMINMEDCVGEFEIFIDISPHELIPTDDIATSMFVPRVWYDHRRDFRFDNIGVALLTLFQVLTTEGWPQVRNLFDSEPFSTRPLNSWIMSIYIHLFVFIGVNIVLQLFVGIVVNNYNEHKPNHSALLTVSQKRWFDLVERISLTRPIKKPPVPRHSSVRKALYRVFSYLGYRNFAAFAVLFSSAVFWVPWTTIDELTTSTMALIYVSIGFSVLFIIELVLKLIAFGPNYFNSFRNVYDFLLCVLSVAFIAMASYYMTPGNRQNLDLQYVTDMALSISVLRLFTILMKYRVFQNLMETVVKTIYRSLRLLFVLAMTMALYSFVGTLFFGNIRSGEALDYSLVNFNGIFVSIHLVIRIMTGEDWYQIFWDTMVGEPYCSDSLGNCGNVAVAVLWFISFYILVSFFLINVIIAVLLENFSIFYEDDDTELNRSAVKDFKQNWFYFDKKATGKISSLTVKLFLRMLRIKVFYTYKINENGVKERQGSGVLSDSLLLREMAEELRRDHRQHGAKAEETGGSGLQQEVEPNKEHHSFQNVLKMVAYRVEDISKRLVPHELYVREELEQSVQFDVAEDCIFKWMQRFVKPVIIKQEKHRRQTVAQLPRQIENKETVMWDPPSLNVPEDEWIDQPLSADSEDEGDMLTTSLVLPSLQSSFLRPGDVPLTRSDDEMEVEADVSEKERNVARSYAKLAELGPPIDPGRRDKWHDWIKMQSEWMDKVETDPDNYFDDYL